jgi:pimeloyl-ACP methyl ester carboxylesterase
MSGSPHLGVTLPRGEVRAVALVLHGGRAKGTGPVRAIQLAVVRMAPFAASLRRAGRDRGLAVARLRYLVRGWNGDARSPVADVEWALGQLAERFPGIPVALVGHSMGGRAAIYAAGHPAVRAVVGLAPWLESGDPFEPVAGRHVLVAHGDLDRITNPAESAAWTQRARTVAASATYVSIHGERHAMLRRARLWHRLTTTYVINVMFDDGPNGTNDGPIAKIISKVLAGQASLVV